METSLEQISDPRLAHESRVKKKIEKLLPTPSSEEVESSVVPSDVGVDGPKETASTVSSKGSDPERKKKKKEKKDKKPKNSKAKGPGDKVVE